MNTGKDKNFNIEHKKQKNIDRRSFMKKLLLGGTFLLGSSAVLNYCDDESSSTKVNNGGGETKDASKQEPTLYQIPEEKGMVLNYPGDKLLIVRDNEDKVYALSNICTHQSCYVKLNPSSTRLECPCHRSIFALDGALIEGIAKRPLDRYRIKAKGSSMVDVNTRQVYKYEDKEYDKQFVNLR